jgi:transcriptional regulator with XRE-family HTH domain
VLLLVAKDERRIAEVGARIKEFRTSQKMIQKTLADLLEVSRGYLSEIESGTKEPSYNILRKLLDATILSSEWLLRGTGEMLQEKVKEGDNKAIDRLVNADLERLDCGLFGLGDKVYVPLSSISACCGRGFFVYDDYNVGEAIAVNIKNVGILQPDMLPYAVQTYGRSMEGYGIKEGSTVVVNPAEQVFSGCVALVVYDEKASVKKVYDRPDGKDLVASTGQKIHVTYEELAEEWGTKIRGRVMVVIAPPDEGI